MTCSLYSCGICYGIAVTASMVAEKCSRLSHDSNGEGTAM